MIVEPPSACVRCTDCLLAVEPGFTVGRLARLDLTRCPHAGLSVDRLPRLHFRRQPGLYPPQVDADPHRIGIGPGIGHVLARRRFHDAKREHRDPAIPGSEAAPVPARSPFRRRTP